MASVWCGNESVARSLYEQIEKASPAILDILSEQKQRALKTDSVLDLTCGETPSHEAQPVPARCSEGGGGAIRPVRTGAP